MTECTMTNDEIADSLEKAADVVHVQGLAKGELFNDAGKVCTRGALFTVLGFRDKVEQVDTVLKKFLWNNDEFNKECYVTVPGWNDAPERTQGEVEDALRHAAKELRA